ncbi:MAG: hypothetical protein HKN70_15075 [Gammaproteobacteria bacterium]|nr:hypothetical protein [Gammaproteobacteria bacterium]
MSDLRCLTVFLLSMIVVSTPGNTAADFDWQEVHSDGNIVVKQRDVPGSGYKETQGRMQTDASLFAILAVLKDSSACAKWLYKCKHGETVSTISTAERVYYTVIDAPLLLRDRDMYVRSRVAWDPTRERIDIALSGVAGYAPERKGTVRVQDLRGQWVVQRTADDHLLLIYQIYSNPQVVPKSAANRMMIRSVSDTLKNVSRLARSKKYSAASLSAEELDALTQVK